MNADEAVFPVRSVDGLHATHWGVTYRDWIAIQSFTTLLGHYMDRHEQEGYSDRAAIGQAARDAWIAADDFIYAKPIAADPPCPPA